MNITRGIASRKGENCEQLLSQQTASGRLNRKVSNRAHALKHRYRRRWISEQQHHLVHAFGALRALWDSLYVEIARKVSWRFTFLQGWGKVAFHQQPSNACFRQISHCLAQHV